MLVFPNCKINIGLYVTSKRQDGFHNIETIFYPITLQDALEVIVPSIPLPDTKFIATGLPISGNSNTNLCLKAFNLLQEQFPQIKNVEMYLHKTIPMGAGLGGGSANGAFTLLLLNNLFQLQLTREHLINYALQLGSDCPFFIVNAPCFATSRGEALQQIHLSLNSYYIVIVNPQIHINTGWAFSKIIPQPNSINLQEAILKPIETWKHNISNVFEVATLQEHKEIANIKNELYHQGALYASMSGTGSTVYGIFNHQPTLHFPTNYFVHTSKALF